MGAATAIELPDETSVSVEVPAGTQPGDVISVKSKGMPRVDGRGRGALQVVVTVDVPRHLTARAKELIRDLETELSKHREKARTGS
jgi:molecular chaperone DnaJ